MNEEIKLQLNKLFNKYATIGAVSQNEYLTITDFNYLIHDKSFPLDAEVKVNFAELESIQYLNKMRELINLGDGININARLLILRRKIIDDVESLSKSKISA